MSSRLSRCHASSHRYAVRYARPLGSGALPAPPWWPLLNGRKYVPLPSNLVVMNTKSGSTAKCTSARFLNWKIGSFGSRSFLYCHLAFSTVCPLMGFFNSAVTTGRPLSESTRSSEFSFFRLYLSWRVAVRRLASYSACVSGLSPLAGAKYATRSSLPKHLNPWRSTLSTPCESSALHRSSSTCVSASLP
jgi:hypothetical protein